MKAEARIIVIGDDNVGKTSIIAALVEEKFVEDVPHVLSDVFIPAEIVSEGVPMYITDTSNHPDSKASLAAEIEKNDSIVLVYDVESHESFERLRSYWLPYLNSLGIPYKPIILVGSKIDTRGEYVVNEGLEANLIPIMDEFPNIEVCVECSAKLFLNIADVFLYALKYAMYPTHPIYDTSNKILRPRCIEALARIFRIFDKNNDGYLDDEEFNNLHTVAFETTIQTHELEEIKGIIRDLEGTYVPYPYDKGMTLSEFLTLHLHFIQRGRSEMPWKMLRKFGYDDDLNISEDYIRPKFDVPQDSSVELTARANQFLVELFKKYDTNSEAALSMAQLESLFKMAGGNPWKDSACPLAVSLTSDNKLTLTAFLAQWNLMTLLEPKKTVELLAYFGFQNILRDGLRLTPSRSSDRSKGKCSRNVLRCMVVGAIGTGKTTLLQKFRDFDENYPSLVGNSIPAIKSVRIGPTEKFLVMEEISPNQIRSIIHNNHKDFLYHKLDVLILTYDVSDSNSFSYIAGLCKDIKLDNIPVVMMATKLDLGEVKQRYPVQPKDFARQKHWKAPIEIDLRSAESFDPVLQTILDVALNPNLSMTQQSKSSLRKWIYALSTASLALGTGYAAYWVYTKYLFKKK